MELSWLREVGQLGVPTLSIAVVIVLWRQLVAQRKSEEERNATLQDRYEKILVEAIKALVRVNDHLDTRDHEDR